MANKVTKISAWPFLVIVNAWSYWPYNSQLVTLFYWYSLDKNLEYMDIKKETREYLFRSLKHYTTNISLH